MLRPVTKWTKMEDTSSEETENDSSKGRDNNGTGTNGSSMTDSEKIAIRPEDLSVGCTHDYEFRSHFPTSDTPLSPRLEKDGETRVDLLTEFFFSSDLPDDQADQIVQDNDYEKIWDLLIEMKNLKVLSLSFLNLPCIPNVYLENCLFTENLECLYLTSNKLDDLPDAMRVLQNLKKLQLGRNRFTRIPDVIGRLHRLESLDMSKNQLSEEGIEHLKFEGSHLKELHLNANYIRTLPPNILKLKELIVLDASYNELEYLPDNFDQLENLRYVRLKQNRLKCLPDALGQMKALEVICVSENRLQWIPAEKLTKLPKLRLCCLHSNRLGHEVVHILKKAKFQVRLGDNRIVDPKIISKIAWDKLGGTAGCHMVDVVSRETPVYDVFILDSGHEDDKKLIDREILPKLENESVGLKACVGHRDFIPGHFELNETTASMEKSRAIIALLTEHFDAESKAVEINQAVYSMTCKGRQKKIVIPIVWGDPESVKIPDQLKKIVLAYSPVNWDKVLTAIKEV